VSAERQAFIDWFRSLKPEEAVEVWWDCDALTAAEVRTEFERVKAENAALRAVVEVARRLRRGGLDVSQLNDALAALDRLAVGGAKNPRQ
jgi:hypothetical protein